MRILVFAKVKSGAPFSVLRLLLCSFLKLTLKPDRTDIYRAVETSALRLLEDPVALLYRA